ncbi:MAG: hypothetical protein JW953_06230 [Anaerolineae bacterium]|nr:hypothetical protein [Anaerolineae bacterium]
MLVVRSAWPRLPARTLPGRQYVYEPGRGFKGKPVVPGYTYSFLDWVLQAGAGWSLSVDVKRVKPDSSNLLVGVAQVKRLCAARAGLTDLLDIIVGDCKYSHPEFLRAVQFLPCGKVTRLAKHRVLCGQPEPKPAGTWLLWLPPQTIPSTVTLGLETIGRAYDHRWPIERGNRFRKQTLNWPRPQFQTPAAGDRWTTLVTLAFWQLYLARSLVANCPLPWQPKQSQLSPARGQQGWPDIFLQIDQPTRLPQTREKSPGWPIKVSHDGANSVTLWSKNRPIRQISIEYWPETRLLRFKFNPWLRPG